MPPAPGHKPVAPGSEGEFQMDLTKQQLRRLEAASCIGRHVRFKNKDGSGHEDMGVVLDEAYIIVFDYKHMIQRIRRDEPYWDGSRIGYRTCYYTFDAKKKHVKFGQYTQFLTEKEYAVLLSEAKAKGWPILR